MLGLNLRPEFRTKRISGTMSELSNAQKTGATQRPAPEFLEISYPTTDLLSAIEAIGPKNDRPVVFIGERGQGKSHLMAVLYHALTDQSATQAWLDVWASRLQYPKMATLPLRQGMYVITESLVHQNYKFLWDLLLERHPHGSYVRGKWEGQGAGKTDILSYDLTLELLQKQPTALILDEYQTWFDGLTNTKQYPWKNWALNFIQILSEIAKSHPELLLLVVSVRNGNTDAYQQIHRVDPLGSISRGHMRGATASACCCTGCSKTASRSLRLRLNHSPRPTSRSTCAWRRRRRRTMRKSEGRSTMRGRSRRNSSNCSKTRCLWPPARRRRGT